MHKIECLLYRGKNNYFFSPSTVRVNWWSYIGYYETIIMVILLAV